MAPRKVGGPAAGLPPGVDAGPLGARFVAYLIDRSVPAVVAGLASVMATQIPDQRTLILVIAGVLILAWALLVWQMFAMRAAGPGMRLMKLQLVGYTDGRPIGWGRFFLRWLVLALLATTSIGLLFMIIFLVRHPRRQGWHDLAADSVVIKERVLAPPRSAESAAPAAVEPSRAPTAVSAPEDTAPVNTAPSTPRPIKLRPSNQDLWKTRPLAPAPGRARPWWRPRPEPQPRNMSRRGRWPPTSRRAPKNRDPANQRSTSPRSSPGRSSPLPWRTSTETGGRWTRAGWWYWTTAARSRSAVWCCSGATRSPGPARRTLS